ncbi:unnamed protein product, partial [Sphacelaria rigidula]
MDPPGSSFAKYAYSVVHINCINNFSHTHEVGHNMGANHDEGNSNAYHEYAYAYRRCIGNSPFRTVMAYQSDCMMAPRVNVFSNPDTKIDGFAQGTSTANNARAL